MNWYSSINGDLGIGDPLLYSPANLTPGEHLITARLLDPQCCYDNCIVRVLHIDIEQSLLNVCWQDSLAQLDLTPGSYVGSPTDEAEWTYPSALGDVCTGNRGYLFTFDPSQTPPGEYKIKAGSSHISCFDEATVKIYKSAFVEDLIHECWNASGTFDASANLTADSYDTSAITWTLTKVEGDPSADIDPDNGLVSFGPNTGGKYTIRAASTAWPSCYKEMTLFLLSVDLKSIEFTSDHGVLKDNNSDWSDTGADYATPEWVMAPARNYPISHSRNSKLNAEVKVKVVPSGITFDLIGNGPDNFVNFNKTGILSTGADQEEPVEADEMLPNEVCTLVNSINWKIQAGGLECDIGDSGPHIIFVTWSTPYSETTTHKRMAWACDVTAGADTENEIALAIRNKAHDGTFFIYGLPTPSPIWNALYNNAANGVDCIRAAMLATASLKILGVPDVDTDEAYPTGGNPVGDKDANGQEANGNLQLRYATLYPPSTQGNPWDPNNPSNAGYLNNFEGCFKVKIGSEWAFYTVWDKSGPFPDPFGLLKVLDFIRDDVGEADFGQWWSWQSLFGDRYWDEVNWPNEVVLPEP